MLGLLQRNMVLAMSFFLCMCTMNKLQQEMVTSAHLLEQSALAEGIKASGLGCDCMELDIVQSNW